MRLRPWSKNGARHACGTDVSHNKKHVHDWICAACYCHRSRIQFSSSFAADQAAASVGESVGCNKAFATGFFFQHTVLGIKVDLCFSLVRPAWKLMSETSAACVGRLWREAQRDSKFRNCGDTLDFASAVAPSTRTH